MIYLERKKKKREEKNIPHRTTYQECRLCEGHLNVQRAKQGFEASGVETDDSSRARHAVNNKQWVLFEDAL